MTINAAKGLQDVLKTNLGPKGTIKMLVGGAGDIKLTKDVNTLLWTAVAQDDTSGDGTTSTVLFIGELMKQSKRYIDEVDDRVKKIIELKNNVCSGDDNNFVVINQKGIDPPSLDLLARAEGAGAFEVVVSQHLINNVKKTVVQGVSNILTCLK
ncbi:hypothetical protein J5N97_013105 [Dioscorea zingiberensis]|uniref:Uncharacterized protein n=1 Tax=Dioscorea zingiberensis TaxID=325984 RepID=A0A9D5CQ40_9LILI|nr:hypothetical protein J5N97_013105 [Dioscorea zingiberensis]